jgi:isopenicillin-N N-acyltransferase-like protein
MAYKFPLLKVKGSHYEIGLQIGEALHNLIPRVIDQIFYHELAVNALPVEGHYTAPLMPVLTREQIFARTREFLPLFESYCPQMLDELRGISKAADISFEEALLLQIRGEIIYTYATVAGCTSFTFSREVTRTGEVIAGQNWDYPIDLDLLHILHVTPDDGPAQLMMTFAGLTSYMGINEAGIGNFANALPWGWCQLGIPHYPFKWRVLRQTSLDGVREVANQTRTVQPGNYALCDGDGNIGDLELTPEQSVWLENREGFFVHTNHFLGEPYANRPDMKPFLADSIPRYQRFHGLVSEHIGDIDVAILQNLLSDHENYPTSVCRHDKLPGICTSASLISEPEQGLLHVCAGNPCSGEFVTYQL